MKKSIQNLRESWNNMNYTNTGIIGVSEGEEKWERVYGLSEEIMAENFANMRTKINIEYRKLSNVQVR